MISVIQGGVNRLLLFVMLLLAGCFFYFRGAESKPKNAAALYRQAIGELPDGEEWSQIVKGSSGSTVSPEAVALIEASAPVLNLVQKASATPFCDWGVDLAKGPHQEFKFGHSAVKLARLALERARIRFSQGRIEEGLQDWEAALLLARRVGTEPLVLLALSGAQAEGFAVQKIAPYLPRLSQGDFLRLNETIMTLPSKNDLATIVDSEYRLGYGWYEAMLPTDKPELHSVLKERGISKEVFQKQVLELREDLAFLRSSFAKRYPEMLSQLNYSKLAPVTREFLTPLIRAYGNVAKVDCEMAMLRVAVALLSGHPDALTTTMDPLTGAPFELSLWEGGFRLQSRATIDNEPISVVFGEPRG